MKVRTVLGDVAPETLGKVDAHEHLMIVGGPATRSDPDLLLDDVDDATAEVEGFRAAGGGTVVDAMPTGCGRDAAALAEVSRRTGVHIIATAGFHRPRYYDDLHWARRYPVDLLTDVITAEVREGFDRWHLAGPIIDRLPYRPGLLKAATGFHSTDDVEHRMLVAVARVHLATGLPILTHAEHGTHANHQLDVLTGEGVTPDRVAISHMDRNPDFVLHRDLIQRGATLIYDGLYRENYRPVAVLAEVLSRLLDSRLGDSLLLGGDIGRKSLRRISGAGGISGLLDSFVPQLAAEGIDQSALDKILIANAARFFGVSDDVT